MGFHSQLRGRTAQAAGSGPDARLQAQALEPPGPLPEAQGRKPRGLGPERDAQRDAQKNKVPPLRSPRVSPLVSKNSVPP